MNRLRKLLKREELAKASKDPVYFINNYLWTFNPKQEPYHFRFVLFPFQEELVPRLVKAIEEGNDTFIEKCREMGATYVVLAVFFWYWRFVPGSNFLLGSRKEDYVDNTKGTSEDLSNKEESLFGKIEYFFNHLAPEALPKKFNINKHFNYMSLLNPENGNSMAGESSNANFSRGGRQKAILLDEFAFWDSDSAAWGSTADTTNCRIVLTTPGIRPSKAKRLRYGKDGEKIDVITLRHDLDPRKTKQWLEDQRSRRSSEDFAREIMINWEGSIEGRVYQEIKEAKVGYFPYDPAWGLYMSWDFGLDGTAIGVYQINPVNGKLRLVEAYENINRPIQFFLPLTGADIDSTFEYLESDLEAIEAFKPFKKAIHYGDPDVSKRGYQSKDASSTSQILSEAEVYVQTNTEANDFSSRRERTKIWLQRGIEINDTPRTEHWLECITNSRYPKRPDMSQATTGVTKPIHDWSSHHRTELEYLCVNLEMPESLIKVPRTAHEIIMAKIQASQDEYVDDVLGGDY